MLPCLIIFAFLLVCHAGPILNNLPITFQMNGATTYNPDSGGQTLAGYKLSIGYISSSWIAV